MSKLRVLSLFAGIGGFDLGLERAGGFETVEFCEIEPFQRAVLAKHWPHVSCHADIKTMNAPVPADVVCGGFPCQPFSTASRGRRVAPDLWPEMMRIITQAQPEYAILENVSEQAIEQAANDLRSFGFNVTTRNISGNDCGAPHERRRWWAVAHPHEESEFQRALDAEVAKLPELCAGLWSAEAYAGALRVSYGVPHRVHRVEALGNAVIPQIPQVIGAAILKARAGTLREEGR
ncbi:DNA cytosine methyltransferase [Roseibium sp. RKSG952]|uniref:DNA cytosine methyltransferase n=1 Tax=Roseibium sp. RKSG952 TaxID=2529384 RepID=UPI0012BD25CE|nr:DNA cytosine methyltransferase [Roseibium sp. RKSG952]MTH96558.1 DNA cytosine methyltransferase [Roseibium sp. RKSG952]